MPRLLNIHIDTITPGAICIMRPGKWGNKYIIGRDGTREQVVAKHEHDIGEMGPQQAYDFVMDCILELKNRDLFCCCAPQRCHGEILFKIANL